MKYYFIFLAVFISACASISVVVSIRGDAYMVSRSEKGLDPTGSRVKAVSLNEADEFCRIKGKAMEVISAKQKDMVLFASDTQAEVEFRCVSKR